MSVSVMRWSLRVVLVIAVGMPVLAGTTKTHRPLYNDPMCDEELQQVSGRYCYCGGGGIYNDDPLQPDVNFIYEIDCRTNNLPATKQCFEHVECEVGTPVDPNDPWSGSDLPWFGVYTPFDLCDRCI